MYNDPFGFFPLHLNSGVGWIQARTWKCSENKTTGPQRPHEVEPLFSSVSAKQILITCCAMTYWRGLFGMNAKLLFGSRKQKAFHWYSIWWKRNSLHKRLNKPLCRFTCSIHHLFEHSKVSTRTAYLLYSVGYRRRRLMQNKCIVVVKGLYLEPFMLFVWLISSQLFRLRMQVSLSLCKWLHHN